MKALYKMKTHEEAIRSIVDLEKQLDLYRYKVWGIPLWNVIRYKTRRQYLYKETGIDERDNKIFLSILKAIYTFYYKKAFYR